MKHVVLCSSLLLLAGFELCGMKKKQKKELKRNNLLTAPQGCKIRSLQFADTSDQGNTDLHCMTRNRKLDEVQQLLTESKNPMELVNALNKYGKTPLNMITIPADKAYVQNNPKAIKTIIDIVTALINYGAVVEHNTEVWGDPPKKLNYRIDKNATDNLYDHINYMLDKFTNNIDKSEGYFCLHELKIILENQIKNQKDQACSS